MNNQSSIKPIKTIAGEILLFFYVLHRKNPSTLSNWITSFQDYHLPEESKAEGMVNNDKNEIYQNLLNIGFNTVNIYNALCYLEGKGFITYNSSRDSHAMNIYGIGLTAYGIDVVEDIDQVNEEKRNQAQQNFEVNFNITVNNNITVESLIKNELGSLIKNSIL